MRMGLRVLALVTAVAASACGAAADGPPAIVVDRTACAHCGMFVSEPVFAAAYRVRGTDVRIFDDIGCLLEAVKGESDRARLQFWFHDATGGQWMSGAPAVFMKSTRLRTPMGGGIAAYRDAEAAQRAAAQHHGHVVGSLVDLLAHPGGGGL